MRRLLPRALADPKFFNEMFGIPWRLVPGQPGACVLTVIHAGQLDGQRTFFWRHGRAGQHLQDALYIRKVVGLARYGSLGARPHSETCRDSIENAMLQDPTGLK